MQKICILLLLSITLVSITRAETVPEPFLLSEDQVKKYNIERIKEFSVAPQKSIKYNSYFAIVTDFSSVSLETRILPGISKKSQLVLLLSKNLKHHSLDGVTVRENTIPLVNGKQKTLFWIGDRAFSSLKEAEEALIQVAGKPVKEMLPPVESVTVTEQVNDQQVSVTAVETEVVSDSAGTYPFDLNERVTKLECSPINFPEDERFTYMSFTGLAYSTETDLSGDTNLINGGTTSFYTEHRVVMKGLKLPGKESIDPYITMVPKLNSQSDPWANVLEWGAGLEYRFFENFSWLERSVWTDWIQSIRFFAEYRRINFLKDSDDIIPDHDTIVGADVWKRINNPAYDELSKGRLSDLLDTEIWGYVTWRQTGFNGLLGEDYKSWGTAFAVRQIIYWPWITKKLPLETYIKMDGSATENNFWWENRMRIGPGVAVYPFHINKYRNKEFFYTLGFYAQYMYNVAYFKGEPEDDQDEGEFIFGITVNINWY